MSIGPWASFTHTINVTIFVSDTFDLFDAHSDRSNVFLPIKVPVTTDIMLNFDGNFDGLGDGDIAHKHTFTQLFCKLRALDLFLAVD